MTEYKFLISYSGAWAIKQNDGTIKNGTSYYMVVVKKDMKTGIYNCKPIVIKASEDTYKQASTLKRDTVVNLYFDENQMACGINPLNV